MRFLKWCLLVTAGLLAPSAYSQTETLSQDIKDLTPVLHQAVEAVREAQLPPGYWYTRHTRRPIFTDSVREVSPYLQVLMVDLLAPVARQIGLEETIASAQDYASRQVEETGLVRYLGRPGQDVFRLGCDKITPDADDTALVWRTAPPAERSNLQSALRTLEAYRTEKGLYRTWLSPQDEYLCIDPGKEPNPVDIGIQMHVYQFLAKYQPESSRDFCPILKRAIGEERFWVYYEKTPLVPLLRESDLARAGCAVKVPQNRLHLVAPEQKVWIDTARFLRDLLNTEEPPPSREVVIAHLQSLSADGFSLLEHAPPLLYHNDLTASVSRFYWSQDVGLAMWIRLYCEALGCAPDTDGPKAAAMKNRG